MSKFSLGKYFRKEKKEIEETEETEPEKTIITLVMKMNFLMMK